MAFDGVAAHHVGVDAEGELGVGVPELAMTEAGSSPQATRIEAKAWRSLCGVRPLGQRRLLPLLQEGRQRAHRGGEDAVAQVVLVADAAARA